MVILLEKEDKEFVLSHILEHLCSVFEYYFMRNIKKRTAVKVHDIKAYDISELEEKDYHVKLLFHTLKNDNRLPNTDLEKAVRETVTYDMNKNKDRSYVYAVPPGKKFLKVDINPSTNIDYVVKVRLEKR